MSNKPPKEPKKSMIVEEELIIQTIFFDSNGCALIFKKLRIGIGEEEEETILKK
jgi:hypothetical protein